MSDLALMQLMADVRALRAEVANLKTLDTAPANVGAHVFNSVASSVPTATITALTFDSERYDPVGMHDPATNTSRLTCQVAGRYVIIGQVSWAVAAGGRRFVRLRLNGGTDIATSEIGSAADTTGNPAHIVATIYDLAVGTYVELTVYQTSGAALNVLQLPNMSPELMAHRLG